MMCSSRSPLRLYQAPGKPKSGRGSSGRPSRPPKGSMGHLREQKAYHTLTLRKRPWYRLRHVRRRPAANGAAHPRVRQPHRGGSGERERPPGRAALHHRAQRRRQDDVLPPHLRRDGAHRRTHLVRRSGHHRAAPARRGPAGDLEVLPDHERVSAPHLTGECPGGRAGPRPRLQLLVAGRPAHRCARARPDAPGEGGAGRQGHPAGGPPLPRREAPPGDRHRAGLRSRPAAARRADGGHEPRGDGRDDDADPRAGDRPNAGAGRAQDEGRHEDLGPDHGAPSGPGAGRRHARGEPGQRARAADVPGRRPMTLLALEDVHTYYGEAHILQGISLTVGQGEVVTLIGRNGAGKTTTLRSIMGIARPRRGRVRLGGEGITPLRTPEIAPRGVAWVPEERRLPPNPPVLDNLRPRMLGAPGIPRRRLSSTVRLGRMRRSSGTQATPRRAISCVPSRVMSSPPRRTRPRRGRALPLLERSVVVLPAPLRPISVTTSPWPTVSETPWRMWASP